MKLSAVILTKNEEKKIVDCIESLNFCDEIIVMDDMSTDKTVDIIHRLKNPKVTVSSHSLDDNFSDQRNRALQLSQGEWVFFVDADEKVSKQLAADIQTAAHNSPADIVGYTVMRTDVLWGKKLLFGETGNARFLRLARKDAGKWEGKVHEVWKIKGKVRELYHPLLHYPHESISEFLTKINVYSTLRAEELHKKKVKSNIVSILVYPKGKFLKNYLVLRGYKDGTHGFIHAMIMSFHSFLVRGKLYLLWKGIKNT